MRESGLPSLTNAQTVWPEPTIWLAMSDDFPPMPLESVRAVSEKIFEWKGGDARLTNRVKDALDFRPPDWMCQSTSVNASTRPCGIEKLTTVPSGMIRRSSALPMG